MAISSFNTMVLHGFTKLAVSSLILVRFEKFKNWHTLYKGPVLLIGLYMARATARAKNTNKKDQEAFRKMEWFHENGHHR